MSHRVVRGPLIPSFHRRDSPEVPKWWGSLVQNNGLAIVGLVLAFVALGTVQTVLKSADGNPVDEWVVSPSVVLSIVAVAAKFCIGGAFQTGAQGIWWNMLLKDQGASMRDLHRTWEFAHERLPLFYFSRPFNRVRFAGIITLGLGFVGPLLEGAHGRVYHPDIEPDGDPASAHPAYVEPHRP